MTTENPVPLDPVQPRTIIGRMPKYAAGKPPRQVQGLSAFKLSSNENPLPPIPEVVEAIRAQLDINRYPDPLSTKLRNALAQFLSVPAEDIVTGAGSLGALTQILATFAGQDDDGVQDEVVFAWRSFEAYPIVVETAGALPVQVPLMADGRHDLAAMAAAVNENTSVILLCTPNNPTGPALRRDEVEDFISNVPSNVLIVIDEAYQEFVRDPQAVNGIDAYRKYPNVVVLRTFSKAHGLANLRVGYSVSHPEITSYIRVAATMFAVSSVAEDAAVASLAHYDKVVERVQIIVDERTRVVDGLRDLGWNIPVSDGNFVWLPLGERTAEFAELASEQALALRAFGSEGIRVTIGEVEANTRFLELCRNYPKGSLLS
ncbi:histidinol-phosphate transaminase [Paeniglutamicibacter antarcticus]|uniref:Aromatic amino acid aminotransferase n=1 Tax=Paeniglutamicibacter antarcticus TaxID=494023 RepID=A0ABP9TJZ6_9MICC